MDWVCWAIWIRWILCPGVATPAKWQVIWAKLMRRATALQFLFAGCLGLSPSILPQFTFEICAVATNCNKNTITFILKVQSHSKSSKVTPTKSLSLLLVMISSRSVPICNCFPATRANWSKITTLRRVAVFDACLRRPLWTEGLGLELHAEIYV